MHSITLPTAAGGGTHAVDTDALSETIREALMLHGLQQKVADCVSSAKSNGWTEEQSRAKCLSVIAALMAGSWAQRGGGGPRANDEESFVTARVLAKIKATIKAKKASMPDEAALTAHAAKVIASPKHAEWIASLRAEYAAKRAAKGAIDLDSLDLG
jgi:hypothetical protein